MGYGLMEESLLCRRSVCPLHKNFGLWCHQDEWTGEQKLQYGDIPEDVEPEEIRPMGNYAVSITWPDGFNQVPYLIHMIEYFLSSSRGFLQS